MKQPLFCRVCVANTRLRASASAELGGRARWGGSVRGGTASGGGSAFTLVEMLAVMAIIVVVLGFAGPAVNSIRGANDFSVNIGTITGFFEQARAYAVANNTYVYVGIGEFNAGQSANASPQAAGNGRLVTCAVATRDGTRGYDLNNPGWNSPTTYSTILGNLSAIDKLHVYDNTHLADFSTNPANGQPVPAPAQGTNMYRPVVSTDYFLGHTDTDPNFVVQTPLAWPLGKALKQGQYNFSHVVQFDPQGVARLQFATSGDSVVPMMEVDLQPTHGNIPPNPPTNQNVGNQAAIQIDCITGGVRFYRP